MMHGDEKSGLAIVAENRLNADGRPSAEGGERRAGAKGNARQTDMRRTLSRASVSPGLERVRTAAGLNKEERFTALLHHVDVDLLRQAYLWLKREAAPGVDGVTWAEYGQGLE
jgi:RNA-directed DNA polymerase